MKNKTYELAGIAVQKCKDGGSISDEELKAGIRVVEETVNALRSMGSCYYLAYSNLNIVLSQLESFQFARKV